jgi:hypothetical protein
LHTHTHAHPSHTHMHTHTCTHTHAHTHMHTRMHAYPGMYEFLRARARSCSLRARGGFAAHISLNPKPYTLTPEIGMYKFLGTISKISVIDVPRKAATFEVDIPAVVAAIRCVCVYVSVCMCVCVCVCLCVCV